MPEIDRFLPRLTVSLLCCRSIGRTVNNTADPGGGHRWLSARGQGSEIATADTSDTEDGPKIAPPLVGSVANRLGHRL